MTILERQPNESKTIDDLVDNINIELESFTPHEINFIIKSVGEIQQKRLFEAIDVESSRIATENERLDQFREINYLDKSKHTENQTK